MKVVMVGLPSSGRTTAANVAQEYGIRVVNHLTEFREDVVVDGINISEFKRLEKIGKVYSVALLTPTKRRYEFSNKSISFEQFIERDKELLDKGLDKLLALADYNIINQGNLEDLKFEARRIFSKIFGFRKIFLWAQKDENTFELIRELFPRAKIYEGENRILGSTDSFSRLEELIRGLKAQLLKYFDIKEKMTHVIEENVLKFGLDKRQASEGKIRLGTSFEMNLKINVPIPQVLMIELITEDPKGFVERL